MSLGDRRKLLCVAALVILANLFDLASTYFASPDLSGEWNILQRFFGLGWAGLVGAKLLGGWLAITGYADAPQISLTSTPELPQDEVLARLLFGVSVKELSALQIAQIGSGLATISGVGGGGFNPLMAVQKTLGLDRLSVGTAAGGGATVQAGRYVSSRVYVGAKQTLSGSTQAQVQVDLTKHLKLQATIGSGGSVQGATPENDPGSSIGLSYQFEY